MPETNPDLKEMLENYKKYVFEHEDCRKLPLHAGPEHRAFINAVLNRYIRQEKTPMVLSQQIIDDCWRELTVIPLIKYHAQIGVIEIVKKKDKYIFLENTSGDFRAAIEQIKKNNSKRNH